MPYRSVLPRQREFAEIMLADPEWLRAEFDAIVEANFPSPAPRSHRPHRPAQPPRDRLPVVSPNIPCAVEERERAPPRRG
ncbi:hypothetical protein LWC34_13650 [Kibdelosporangium philippinense]|uniref:Uncharacterized protein n=1 Tax=Kibdelosporangium philippinense TaxID=211113 RepID=A0ABS8ZB08_9PSEU|nr:hypothetical protein [Kibdelosporangium philippinense]MCE7003866.1 hypothetical protein [Kibdelosporangium philippinense]